MPHLTVEYSKSLAEKIKNHELLKKLHVSLEQCPEVDMNKVKSRLVEHEQVLGGKSGNEIQIIHVTLAILSGRDVEIKKIYGQTLLDTLKKTLTDSIQNQISMTVEIRDMNKDTYFR